MNCYLCENADRPGGLRYGIRTAVGVCQNCGIGVCSEHSFRAPQPGAPLLCLECAQLNEIVVSKFVEVEANNS